MAKKETDRRKKNAAERGSDVLEYDVQKENLFNAVHEFYDEYENTGGDYGWIGVRHYDTMRNSLQKACQARGRMKRDYVASEIKQGQWENTTHSHVYEADTA